MAGNNDIRQKIVLEGEKEYSAALKEAQRNLKVLRSELKAETAEMGKNATAQEKNQAKVKNLQKQIKEQEKVVRTYENALKEVKEKYGDNTEAVAKWEIKLNEARATLGNMKNDLDNIGSAFKNVDSSAQMGVVAAKSFADSLESLGSAADSIANALESAFTSVLGVITDAVSALWDEVMQVAAKANAWTDLADYFGTTADNVQKWSNAIQGAGGKFDDFTTILNRFKTGGVNDKITELFGVSDVNYTDDMEYTVAVLRQMVALRDKMTAAGSWDSAMSTIFGAKKSQAAGWFVSNWENIEKNLERYDAQNGGVGMTSEQLETMNDLYIKVQNIQTTWEAFKSSFLAGAVGELSLKLAGNAQGILDGLIKFMDADNDNERNEAIKQIEENMTEFFTRLGEAIEAAAKAMDEAGKNLSGSENGYVSAIGSVLESFSKVLSWLTKPESLQQVKRFFETLIGLWTGAKVTKAISNVASFMGNLKVLGLFGGSSVASSAAAAGETAGTAWGASFAAAVMKAAPFLAFLYTLLNPADTGDKLGNNEVLDANGNLTQEAKKYGYEIDENGEVTQDPLKADPKYVNPKYIQFLQEQQHQNEMMESVGGMTPEQWQAAQTFWDAYRANPFDFTDDEWDAFESAFEGQEELFDSLNELMDKITQAEDNDNWRTIEDLPADWWSNQNGLTSEDVSGFKSLPAQMGAAVRAGVSNIKVIMDGQSVGYMIAPYVSQQIAREVP